jgi:SAM-dependent methyltransferase
MDRWIAGRLGENVMTTLKTFHDEFYSANILDLDEAGNDFCKISSLWEEESGRLQVLDIGCGAGAVTAELVKRGHTVFGLDIQDEAIRRAQLRGLQARVADLNGPLPFRDRSMDVVLAADIIEHLYDPVRLLAEIRRVLTDDGYALLVIPHHFDIIQRLRMLFGRGIVSAEHLHYCSEYKPWNYVHIRFFTLAEAQELVRVSGFKIECKEPVPLPIFFPLPFRAPLRLVCNRLGRRLFPTLFCSGLRMRVRKAEGS